MFGLEQEHTKARVIKDCTIYMWVYRQGKYITWYGGFIRLVVILLSLLTNGVVQTEHTLCTNQQTNMEWQEIHSHPEAVSFQTNQGRF